MNKETARYWIWITAIVLFLVGGLLIFARPSDIESISISAQMTALGSSLVTAGLLAITIDQVSARAIADRVDSKLDDGIGELNLRQFGIIEIEDSTPYRKISKSILKSKKLVIVQTWCPQLKRMLRAAEHIIEKGGTVDVFLLDPNSEAATRRSIDLDETPGHVKEKIIIDSGQVCSFLVQMKKKYGNRQSDIDNRINLYYYPCSPTCAIYQTDKYSWLALYWISAQSDDEANIVLDASGSTPAAGRVNEQIEALREKSTLVDLQEGGDLYDVQSL